MGVDSHFPKRPGGPLVGKPVQGLDGQWYNQFGEKIEDTRRDQPRNKDADYAQRFWDKGQPKGFREVMIGNLHNSIKEGENEGVFRCSVSPQGINDTDKEKLSAYRVLANELGYDMGPYQFNANSYIASAKIIKK